MLTDFSTKTRRSRAAAAGVLAGALVWTSGSIPPTAQAASAEPSAASQPTYSFATASPLPGEFVRIGGSLAPNEARNVFVQRLIAEQWRTVGRGRTNPKGAWNAVVRSPDLGQTAKFRVQVAPRVVKGVTYPGYFLSETTLTPVSQELIHDPLPAVAEKGSQVALAVDVEPERVNRSLSLQYKAGRRWKSVSRFSFRLTPTGAIDPVTKKPIKAIPVTGVLTVPTKVDATMNMRIVASSINGARPIYSELGQIVVGAGSPAPGDADNDGLLDSDEQRFGTDPHNIDTDLDGLLDGDEVHEYKTDPVKADTDGDGLTDRDEIEVYGTNPLATDTDGDGLTDGYEVAGSVRGLSPNKFDADTDGEGLRDVEEKFFGTDPKKPDTDGDGVTDKAEIDTGTDPLHDPAHTDTDGDGLIDSEDPFPNNVDGDGDGLDDATEVRITLTDPSKFDTDGDGFSDGDEVLALHTDPLAPNGGQGSIDSDQDGLSDVDEATLGLDPNDAYSWANAFGAHTAATAAQVNDKAYRDAVDTDGDGVADSREVLDGTAKTAADSDRDTLADGIEHGADPLGPLNVDLLGTDAYSWAVTYGTRADAEAAQVSDGDYLRVLDTDGDSVPDYREVLVGTSKVAADSDGDGLLDDNEIGADSTGPLSLNLDPLDAYSWAVAIGRREAAVAAGVNDRDYALALDTDGDSVLDYEEVIDGTSKSQSDTDADGLADSTEHGATLLGPLSIDLLGTNAYSWAPPEARASAQAAGVNDRDYYQALDTDNDGVADFQEVLDGTSKTQSDTDGDTLTDTFERGNNALGPLGVDLLATDPYSWAIPSGKRAAASASGVTDKRYLDAVDTDADGLKDYAEVATHGTNPNVSDTDGDGVSDGEEVTVDLTDPLSPASVFDHTPKVLSLVTGSTSCLINNKHQLWCWGQVGIASSTSTPTRYETASNWRSLTNGGALCAIRMDGTAKCFTTTYPAAANAVDFGTHTGSAWRSIQSSGPTQCGIKNDRTLWCRGTNTSGQLAQGDTVNRASLTQVGSLNTWDAVAAVSASGTWCATRTDGTLWCWGFSGSGGLVGDGTVNTNRLLPVQVSTVAGGNETDWLSVYPAGSGHACAQKTDLRVYCWGNSAAGQFGRSNNTNSPVPVLAMGGNTVKAGTLSYGSAATCIVTTSGSRMCSGSRTNGALGDGSSTGNQNGAVAADAFTDWTALAYGYGGTGCAVRSSTTLWCWGKNDVAQVGRPSTTTAFASPVQVLGWEG